MKINTALFSLFIFFLSLHIFASTSDTTLRVDLNFDGKEEIIKLVHNEADPAFRIIINNASATDTFMDAYASYIKVIDMNRNDNLREVLVIGLGPSDQEECFFYQYAEDKIIPCGYLPGNFGIKTSGDGILYENSWMGFWGAELEYDFDPENKMLKKRDKEFYNVNVDAEVKIPFPVLSNRYDQSPVAALLNAGTKITLVKADISPKCRMNEYGYMDEDNCDWYLIRTEDGTEGWCRLKDFRDNVDGLIWAG